MIELAVRRAKATGWLAAGLITCGLFLAKATMAGVIALPCLFHFLTGLPCPLCGGLRCLDALSHGHWTQAFLLNPLVFCSGWGALVFAVVSLMSPHWTNRLIHGLRLQSRRYGWALVGATFLANGLYLIVAGR